MKFTLKDLQAELARILLGYTPDTKVNPPANSPVEPGEKIIGVLEDPMVRLLYSLGDRLKVYLEDYTSTLPENLGTMKPEEAKKHLNHVKQIAAFSKMVSKLMWANIHELFPEATHPKVSTGLRDDWQVVIWKREGAEEGFSMGEILGVVEVVLDRAREAGTKPPADSAEKK